MQDNNDIPLNAPAGGGGPGIFQNPSPSGANLGVDARDRPVPVGSENDGPPEKPIINGTVVAGSTLSNKTISAINSVAKKVPSQWRRYIAYTGIVKVGGSLAWRANNPGNLRDSATKIGSVPGRVGQFAVFASLEDGRLAQKNLYLSKYGDMKVREAINKLTPPSENDTAKYLLELQKYGVNLDAPVKSQIDILMKAVEPNEGLIPGIEITRIP